MIFGLGGNAILGLDIGSSSVKVVELKKKRSGLLMTGFASVAIPEDTIVEGDIIDSNIVMQAIQAAVKEIGTHIKHICTGVSGSSVIVKKVIMPKAPAKELEDQVYWEAEQYIPFDMSEISLDYEVLSPDIGDNKMEILLVAAKREFIDKRINVIKEAGLEVDILDVDVLALANIFWENYEVPKGVSVMLMDIGASLMKINIVSADSTLFTRDVSLGGNTLTLEIQNKLGIGYQEAEVLKIDAAHSQQMPEEILPLINAIAETIALEVKRSLDFYTAATAENPVSSIYLAGGASGMPGLTNALQEMLGLPVQFLNPFNKVQFDSKFNEEFISAISGIAAIPLGLAIRSIYP